MSDIAIRVEGLSKRYRIGGRVERYRTMRDAITDAVLGPFRRFRSALRHSGAYSKNETFWALNDISIEVRAGEVMGVIGRNGAGKSTLLKILSRITEPTRGYAEIRGRVASLLEVGTGFHPELTGRDNIRLNGAILGMKRAEIYGKFDEIVAFAEVDKFVDTPVKYYSSGMYLRLAFAVAAHLDPEILLVDEVLAVGDVAFQTKCLNKMRDVAGAGRTVLLVSHSMASIASLCQSVALLDQGYLKSTGEPRAIIDQYLSSAANPRSSVSFARKGNSGGTGEVRVIGGALLNQEGQFATSFKYGEDLCVNLTLDRLAPLPGIIAVVWIRTASGIPVLHLTTLDGQSWELPRSVGKATIQCRIKRCQLCPGDYFISMWLGHGTHREVDFVPDALTFRMEQGELLRIGFDLSWRHAIFHCEARWSQVEEAHKSDVACEPALSNSSVAVKGV